MKTVRVDLGQGKWHVSPESEEKHDEKALQS